MGTTKLDGPGIVKMATLEDAVGHLQRVHGLVEQMALNVKQGRPSGAFGLMIKRAASPLVGLLKGHFGTISDSASQMILDGTRTGGTEQVKVRRMREAVASIRIQIELATNKVKDQHAVKEDAPPPDDSIV